MRSLLVDWLLVRATVQGPVRTSDVMSSSRCSYSVRLRCISRTKHGIAEYESRQARVVTSDTSGKVGKTDCKKFGA